MSEDRNHLEIKKQLTKIRQTVSSDEEISEDSKSKVIEKLDMILKHVEENKITTSTTQHLRDIVHHLEENSNLIALINEVLAYLPH